MLTNSELNKCTQLDELIKFTIECDWAILNHPNANPMITRANSKASVEPYLQINYALKESWTRWDWDWIQNNLAILIFLGIYWIFSDIISFYIVRTKFHNTSSTRKYNRPYIMGGFLSSWKVGFLHVTVRNKMKLPF